MPVYSLSSKNHINIEVKQQIVDAITDIHCGLTGAPEQFVHVVFSDGVPITDHKKLYLQANVRAGRSESTIEDMKQQLTNQFAKILSIEKDDVMIQLLEIEASWIMEGGYVMPEPGEEDEWMQKVHLALSERENQKT